MSEIAAAANGKALRSALTSILREISVGLPTALTMLSASLAGGVLVFGALGHDYIAFGAAAAIASALFGGALTCLLATNSMIVWGPLITIALVQASLVASLSANPAFAGNPSAVTIALVASTALAGLLQIIFGLGGLTKVVKFAPHPVVAGFINGVSASIFISQIRMFLPKDWEQVTNGLVVIQPHLFVFVLALVAFNFWFASWTKKIQAQLMCLVVGFAAYHLAQMFWPGFELGPTLGQLPIGLPAMEAIRGLTLPEAGQILTAGASDIVLFALAAVVVGSFQSLLAFRMTENMLNAPIEPRRGLAALGLGDIASAVTGGLAISVGAPMTAAAFRSGGRTRVVGLTVSASLLLLVLFLPNLLAAIPFGVIVALLIIVSINAFDGWSVRLLWDVLRGAARDEGLRTYYDLAVVLIVMLVTLTVSVVPGILAGVVAACITFTLNMSQPVVRRRLSGVNARSKRVRAAAEAALLRQSGERWVVLQLGGVLFFGNCEALAREVQSTFDTMDVIVLDCRGVTDIDASGANIIRELLEKTRKLGKTLIFCNVGLPHRKAFDGIVKNHKSAVVFNDLDSALEWVEAKALKENPEARSTSQPLNLDEHDFVLALSDKERDVLAFLLAKREFEQGAVLAAESEPGDRMWLLVKGTVDIRLRIENHEHGRRIASLGPGTTVGEMALVERAKRSATIVAAEPVICWELDRNAFERILNEHPQILNKLLMKMIREMSHRIRNTSEQLRESQS